MTVFGLYWLSNNCCLFIFPRSPICLLNFTDQKIAIANPCGHGFCYECIWQWVINATSTCPTDRQEVSYLLVFTKVDNLINPERIPVGHKEIAEDSPEDDEVFCEICGLDNNEHRLLLCDNCDLGFHCDCLSPPLATVPIEDWWCPTCTRRESRYRAPPSQHHIFRGSPESRHRVGVIPSQQHIIRDSPEVRRRRLRPTSSNPLRFSNSVMSDYVLNERGRLSHENMLSDAPARAIGATTTSASSNGEFSPSEYSFGIQRNDTSSRLLAAQAQQFCCDPSNATSFISSKSGNGFKNLNQFKRDRIGHVRPIGSAALLKDSDVSVGKDCLFPMEVLFIRTTLFIYYCIFYFSNTY